MHVSTSTDTAKKLTVWRKDRGGRGPELAIEKIVRRRQSAVEITDGLAAAERTAEEINFDLDESEAEMVFAYLWEDEDGWRSADYGMVPIAERSEITPHLVNA